MLPNRMTGSWITLPTDALRIYFNLCIIKYFLNIISPNNDMMAMVAAFIVGIVSGAVTMIFILSTPADVPLFTFHFETSILLWLAKNSRPIAATALALAMTLSMLSIINNVQDIMRMQGKGASST